MTSTPKPVMALAMPILLNASNFAALLPFSSVPAQDTASFFAKSPTHHHQYTNHSSLCQPTMKARQPTLA